MSEKTPKIHEAIQSIDPEQADKVTAKYERVMAGIDSALMAKNPVAQSAKDQVDFLAQDLIKEGANKDLDAKYQKKRKELLDDFNQELDVISVSLGLDTEKSEDKKPEASSLKKERAPGFAESFKPTDLQEILHHYSAQERLDMLQQVQEEFELPPERESRLEQLTILITALDSVRTNLLERRTLDEQLYYGASLTIGQVAQYNEAKKIESLIENLQKEGIPAILADDLTVEEFLSKHPFGKEVKSTLKDYSASKAFFDKHGKLKDVIDEKDRMEYYSALVDFLADQRDYQGIRAVIEEQMKEEFEMAESNMLKDIEIKINGEKKRVNGELYDKAKDKIEDLVNASVRKEWRKEGMTEEQINETQNELIELQYKRLQNEYIAKYVLIGKDDDAEEGLMQIGVSKRNQALWEEYKEIFDSKDETFNLASTTWDLILDEIIVNAPLIVVSGVVAGVVVKTLSLGARAVIACTRLGTIGARLAAGGRLARTVYRAGKLGSKATAMITEGFMFELVYNGIQAELLFDQEDWVKRVLWTSATLGLFKAAGKFGGARSVEFNTWFQKVAPKIGDKKVVKLINQMVIQGHIEVAAMLAISGAQHLTEGQIDEFFDHFGYQLFHAYVSVGALHIAGKVIVTAGGKILVPRSKSKGTAEKPSEKDESAAREKRPEKPAAETSKGSGEAAPEKPNFYEKLNSAAESPGSKEVEVSTSRELNDGLDTLRDRGFQFRLNPDGTVTAFKGDIEIHLKETGKLAKDMKALDADMNNLLAIINRIPSLKKQFSAYAKKAFELFAELQNLNNVKNPPEAVVNNLLSRMLLFFASFLLFFLRPEIAQASWRSFSRTAGDAWNRGTGAIEGVLEGFGRALGGLGEAGETAGRAVESAAHGLAQGIQVGILLLLVYGGIEAGGSIKNSLYSLIDSYRRLKNSPRLILKKIDAMVNDLKGRRGTPDLAGDQAARDAGDLLATKLGEVVEGMGRCQRSIRAKIKSGEYKGEWRGWSSQKLLKMVDTLESASQAMLDMLRGDVKWDQNVFNENVELFRNTVADLDLALTPAGKFGRREIAWIAGYAAIFAACIHFLGYFKQSQDDEPEDEPPLIDTSTPGGGGAGAGTGPISPISPVAPIPPPQSPSIGMPPLAPPPTTGNPAAPSPVPGQGGKFKSYNVKRIR